MKEGKNYQVDPLDPVLWDCDKVVSWLQDIDSRIVLSNLLPAASLNASAGRDLCLVSEAAMIVSMHRCACVSVPRMCASLSLTLSLFLPLSHTLTNPPSLPPYTIIGASLQAVVTMQRPLQPWPARSTTHCGQPSATPKCAAAEEMAPSSPRSRRLLLSLQRPKDLRRRRSCGRAGRSSSSLKESTKHIYLNSRTFMKSVVVFSRGQVR